MVEKIPQVPYSASKSKEILDLVLNDPNYVIMRWNPSKKVYEKVYPYQVFRSVVKKLIQEAKCPNRMELETVDDIKFRIYDELVELLPELVTAHLDQNTKFKLLTTPDFNGTISKKFVPAGEKVSDVRNIKENKVEGQVKTEWTDHYVVKCSSKRPDGTSTKTRI